MAKIYVTENDIRGMVLEGVKRVFEAIKRGTAKGSGTWDPQDIFIDCGLDGDEIDAMIRKYPQIEWNGYEITVSVSSTEYSGEDGPGNVADYGNDKSFGGEYDTAVAAIEEVPDPVLRDKLTQSLNDFCESLEYDSFEESYPEDFLDLEESMTLQEGREYDTWLGHSDIPGSDGRFFNVVFYLGSDGQIGYRINGDSNQRDPEPYEPQPGSWLDKQIRNYMNTHMGEIRANLFI